MNYPLFIFFGLVPSVIWLYYYLKKDKHPEPKKMISFVFFWGMLSTFPAILIELGFKSFFQGLPVPHSIYLLLYVFIGVAFVEEILKYLVVRSQVFNKKREKEIDEPIDIMEYMIVGALGFAALENIFVLLGLGPTSAISEILFITILRLLGATFLHALASGIFGYFIALSILKRSQGKLYFTLGLTLAVLLHGFFNL